MTEPTTPRIDPREGLRPIMQAEGDEYVLRLVYYQEGVEKSRLYPSQSLGVVKTWPLKGDDASEADRLRTVLLAEAICRFVNTGGPPGYAVAMLDRALIFLAELGYLADDSVPVLSLPGYVYHSAEPMEDTRFCHYFKPLDPAADAIRWEEPYSENAIVGGLVEFLPAEDLADEEEG